MNNVVPVAKRFTTRFFSKIPEVKCVLITGSIARGDCNPEKYGYSVDICLVHTNFEVIRCFEGINFEKFGRFINLIFENINFTVEPLEKSWIIPFQDDMDSKYYALKESIMLNDKDGTWQELIDMKLPLKWRINQINACFQQSVYHINNYRISKWLMNGNLVQCQLNLSDGFVFILKLLYLLNDVFIPREDYLLYLCKKLRWLPEAFMDKASDALTVKEMTLKDILYRRKVMAGIILEIKAKISNDQLCILDSEHTSQKIRLNFEDSELIV